MGSQVHTRRLQVNHLSMALLSLLLLPNLLRASELRASTSRFVVNSSGMYVSQKFGEDVLAQPSILAALNDEGHYPPDQMRLRYEASKREPGLFLLRHIRQLTRATSAEYLFRTRLRPAHIQTVRGRARSRNPSVLHLRIPP